MVLNVTSMLERLQVQAVSDQHYLEECLDVFGAGADEENNTTTYNNPVIGKVLEESDIDGFRTLTNFTPAEFDTVWCIVEGPLVVRWMDGRGRKPTTTAKDVLFMTLVIMKHYQTSEKHGVDFGIKAPTLEKTIMRVIDIASPVLYDAFVTMPSMAFFRDQGSTFANFPYAKYATDVRSQPSHRPSGRLGEQKYYFSGKHKLYGLKIEASVSPQGSVADMTMFRNRHDVHVEALTKKPDEVMVNDNRF
ncbi:hypothetical protein H310_12670 [Aphanomyces invadans]|uniref:DDE Tnp4 domain-containing protein n=1 Tax=Aphanomyces invadans TaxID=157072 RepID=A0A024TH16_9STRA|nr:hypothetical protein H310_12670 [Aphanomyces invadans]ETV93425.1 hypothetical protein H310_12670 [Aphanomyces invadans]|eukprot:XP_008878061.1 hypothetical protein H310_12670 [Aphanomyces invadans]